MAKIKVKFNNKDYQIEESAFAPAGEKVVTHLTGEMKGTGATVKFGGTAYDVDSAKLGSSAAALAAHLGAIVGSGVKIVIGGVEYGVDAVKVAGAVTEVETTLAGMSGTVEPDVPVEPEEPEVDVSQGLEYTLNNDGMSYTVSGIGTCTDADVIIPTTYNGKPVTVLGNLDYCPSIISITIPHSVTFIYYGALSYCYSMTDIHYEGTIAEWQAIDTMGITQLENLPVHCVDGDTIASRDTSEDE